MWQWREEGKAGSVVVARALVQGCPCWGYWYAGRVQVCVCVCTYVCVHTCVYAYVCVYVLSPVSTREGYLTSPLSQRLCCVFH